MKRLAALLLAAAVGCGGGADASPATVIAETSKKLEQVRSGELAVDLAAKAGDGKAEVGFSVDGTFGLEDGRPLPLLDMGYTERPGSGETRIVSTGAEAFVVTGGTAYRLPESALAGARGRTGLGGLDIERWLVDPKLEEGGEVDTIRAKVDAVNALNDLSSIAASVGQAGAFPRIEGKDAEQLRAAARDSSIVVTTGHEDRLLRRIELTVTLAPANPDALPAPLRALAPVTISMTLELTRANQPVTVTAPPNPKPYSELPKG